MRMKVKSLAIAATIALAIVVFQTRAYALVIDGYGKQSCGDFIELMQNNPDGKDAASLGLWSMGYLLGAARHSKKIAPLNISNTSEAGQWLGQYCVANPDTKLIDALDAYIELNLIK